ncbi:MAG: hypothetical protein L6R38_006316, partial [Xanthoria sp. 2 TBL-2021]
MEDYWLKYKHLDTMPIFVGKTLLASGKAAGNKRKIMDWAFVTCSGMTQERFWGIPVYGYGPHFATEWYDASGPYEAYKYEDDARSSDEFYGSSEVAESSGGEDLEETKRLRRATMLESKLEIDDQHHESEDEEGNYVVKRSGIPDDVVKSGARKDMREITVYRQKRCFELETAHEQRALLPVFKTPPPNEWYTFGV